MDDALVSVVVPTYNRAYCICRTIDSIREQTHQNWEILLVDDGSTDDTAALIKSTYGDNPRIRYIHQQNAGVSAARNTGIRASRGDFVALLDSDDQWKPWKLETQLACFRAFPDVGMVWTNFEAVDNSGKVVNERHLTTMYDAHAFFGSFENLFGNSVPLSDILHTVGGAEPGTRVYVGNIYTQMLRGNLVHTSTVMLSRDRIDKVREFDESLKLSGEDYDFHFRTCKWGDVCFVDASSTVYQVDFSDRLTRYKLQIAQNFLKTVEKAIDREQGTSAFPTPMISEVLAEAHAWIAEELFKIEDFSGVRKHALFALRLRVRQPKLIGFLGLASMPRPMTRLLLRSYRTCKSLIASPKRS